MTDSDPNKRPRICTCPSGACTCGIAGPGNAPLLDVLALGGATALPPHPPAPVGGIISEEKTIMMRQYSWAQHYERHHLTCSECNGTWELFEVNNPDMAPGGVLEVAHHWGGQIVLTRAMSFTCNSCTLNWLAR